MEVVFREFKVKQAYVKVEHSMVGSREVCSNASIPFPRFIGMQFYASAVNAELLLSRSEGYLVLECNVSIPLK